MTVLTGQRALVLGRDPSGEAALALLRARGAFAVLHEAGAAEGGPAATGTPPDLVVVSAGCGALPGAAQAWAAQGVPVIGERELAWQQSLCLHVAVTGAAGKSTVADLVAHLLRASGRKVEVADAEARPACRLADASRELDFLIHAVAPSELALLPNFRPVVGVLLNLGPDSPEEPGAAARLAARLFARQQAFDWAVVQAEALERLEAAGAGRPPGKVVTFSGSRREADLGSDRGLLVSRWPGWTGPLWDMARGAARGPHLEEDILASLAVSRVLRLALEDSVAALASFVPGPGRGEELGTSGGVRFIHDGRSSTLLALEKALLTVAPTPPDLPRVVLVAGGDRVDGSPYELGPLLASRVARVHLFGAAAPALQAAWNLFTPCSLEDSLLNAVRRATHEATAGDVVLFSPACPSRESVSGTVPDLDPFRGAVRSRLMSRPGAEGAVTAPAPEGAPP